MDKNVGIITRSTTRRMEHINDLPIHTSQPRDSPLMQHSPILVSILSPAMAPVSDTLLRPEAYVELTPVSLLSAQAEQAQAEQAQAQQAQAQQAQAQQAQGQAQEQAQAQAGQAQEQAQQEQAQQAQAERAPARDSFFGDIETETTALTHLNIKIFKVQSALHELQNMEIDDKLYIYDDKLHIDCMWPVIQGITRFLMGQGRIVLYNFMLGKINVYLESIKALRDYVPIHSINVISRRDLIASVRLFNNKIEDGLEKLRTMYGDFSELHYLIADFKVKSKFYLG